MIEKFLTALPTAASSPYAFVAYLALIATFTYVSIAQFRLRTIARVLGTLPENDRGPLLQKEYNVLPSHGLTAEEWIRSRRQMLVFWFLVVLMASLLVIVVIAIHEIPSQAAAAESAKQERLVAFWQSEQARLENLLRDGRLSQDSYATILVSLNSLSTKLADPSAATIDFSVVANRITKSLDDGDYRLAPAQIQHARLALSNGSPSAAKAILKEAAANDLSKAADSFYQIGLLSEQEANYSDSDLYYKKAVELAPDNSKYLDAYEITQALLGHYDESEKLLIHARQIEEAHGGVTPARERELNLKLAYVYLVSNRFQRAESIYIATKMSLEKDGNVNTLEYAFLLNNLGSLYHNWGRYNEASALLTLALDRLTSLRGSNDPEVAKVLSNTAHLNTLIANFAEVPQLLDRSIAIFGSRYGPRNAELINPLNNYARYDTALKNFQDADRMLAEAFAIGELRFGGKHPWIGRTYDLAAESSLASNDFGNACSATKSALQVKSLFYESSNLELARTLKIQGSCHLGLGLKDDARDDLSKAKEIITSRLGQNNIRIAEVDAVFSDYYLSVDDMLRAGACLLEARDIADKQLGALHPFSQSLEKKILALNVTGMAQSASPLC